MAGLEIDRKQLMVVLMVLAAVVVVLFWMYWRSPQVERLTELQTTVDSLQRRVNIARRDLARGSVEDIRRTIRGYQGSLDLMRVLVPAGNEIPSLLDDIRSRAGRRDVRVAEFSPQTVEPGDPFDTHRYRLQVFGHYDQIGEFLTDVASLQRIMVPIELTLAPADQADQTLYADTSGALLEAAFQVRTFVKPSAPSGVGNGQ